MNANANASADAKVGAHAGIDAGTSPRRSRMPVLFSAHGSPMNIVADNDFTRDLVAVAARLPKPESILVVSAHWQSRGSFVTSSPRPKQIYDFSGFPPELYKVSYSAPGDPRLAEHIAATLSGSGSTVLPDPGRGIDHGAWSVLHHMYPAQDIPVLQLSLDAGLSPGAGFEFAQRLAPLREEGVLVVGSGNIVHSFDEVDFDDNAEALPWAIAFDALVKEKIDATDTETLIGFGGPNAASRRAFRTNEHYLPMLYALALREDGEPVQYFHESIQNASMGMRCFMIGGA